MNYTYAEARWTETLPDWISAHVNALAAIGGVPKALVPDNLKAGITKPSRHELGINRTYQDLADHYGCVVLPTRVRKPRDKAKVAVAVQIAERFVPAKLRHRRFFSLAELNAAIRDCVETMLTHPTQDRLVTLGLAGMAKALEEQRKQPDIAALSFEDRLALMVDREAIERDNKKLVSRLKFASLRQSAVVEDVDMKAPRGLDKALFAKLVAGDWIARHQGLLICGPMHDEAREDVPGMAEHHREQPDDADDRRRRVAHSLTTRRDPRKPRPLSRRHSSAPLRQPAFHCSSRSGR